MKIRRSWSAIALTLVAFVAATLPAAGSAAAGLPGLDLEDEFPEALDVETVEWLQEIQIEVQQESSDSEGVSGVRLLSANEAELFYRGSLPPIDAPNGLKVRATPAEFTTAELASLAQTISADYSDHPTVPVVGAYPKADLSGLVLEVDTATVGTALTPAVQARLSLALPQVEVPIEFRPGKSKRLDLDRWNSGPPWRGGVLMYSTTSGGVCTAGFSARTSGGTRFMLTAEHCSAAGLRFENNYQPGNNVLVGQMTTRNSTRDIAFLTGGAAYEGRIDWGGVVSTAPLNTYYSILTVQGHPICISGAYSGGQCGQTVEIVNYFYGGRGPFIKTTGATAAAGQGDSGGPVFVPVEVAPGDVRAAPVGVVSFGLLGDGQAPCQGVTNGRTCFSKIYHADIASGAGPMGYNTLLPGQ